MTSPLVRQARDVQNASRVLARASDAVRRELILNVAERLAAASDVVLRANAADLADYDGDETGRDRLRLTPERLISVVEGLRHVAELPDPLGEVVSREVRPNGLIVQRVRVPLGVVGVIYENRPNVTMDVAALCVRSGNAAFLRGSSSAQRSNLALVALWHDALAAAGLPTASVSLVEDPSHAVAVEFMKLNSCIDCLIPRGGPSLIAAMREHATVPYVIDGDGNCHVYVDVDANLDMAADIVSNAKISRPGVCNAAESLLVHEEIATEFLPRLTDALPGVEIRGDARVCAAISTAVPATEEDFAKEFLGPIISVAVVSSIDAAIEHVATYGTGHSEAIVTDNENTAKRWITDVDAAAVVVNASTRFVDGGELGLGAEVGISTQKLHARGPMGIKELTCVKWVVQGKGHVR